MKPQSWKPRKHSRSGWFPNQIKSTEIWLKCLYNYAIESIDTHNYCTYWLRRAHWKHWL